MAFFWDSKWARRIEDRLGDISAVLQTLKQRVEVQMTEIGDAVALLVTEVQETKAGIDSALVFIQGLKEQIQTLIDAGAVTPAQLQDLANQLDQKQQEIAAAIVANPPTP
jgi:uncharacterized protein YoxC